MKKKNPYQELNIMTVNLKGFELST